MNAVVKSFADLANLVVDKATGKQLDDAIEGKQPRSEPKAISATGLVSEFALQRISKKPIQTIHYVTEQGFYNLFTATDEPSITFVNMVESACDDDFDYVRDCLRKSVSDMPHNTTKEPNKATAAEHSAYQAAMTRKSEFSTILGAVKFCGISMRLAEPINGRIYKGKTELLIEARAALSDKGIDWRGELVALKDQRKADRLSKSARKQALDVLDKALAAGKIDLSDAAAQLSAVTQAVADKERSDRIAAKLVKMVEKADKQAEGLLKFYEGDIEACKAHIQQMLLFLTGQKQSA